MNATLAPPRNATRALISQMLAGLESGRTATLDGVSWADYTHLLAERDATRRGVRLNYARGVLSLMTTSFPHERWKIALSALILCAAEEFDLPAVPAGQLTISREDLDRGIEPDDSYYIANSARVLRTRELDFQTDPPPDLVVEIEYSRTVADRLPFHAALGIPEVWTYDGEALTMLRLDAARTYQPVSTSVAIPGWPGAEAPRFVQLADGLPIPQVVRQFRTWLREHRVGGTP